MKGFIGFLGLLAFLGLAYVAQDFLRQSVEDQQIIEWSNSLVWAAIGSQSTVEFIDPNVTPGDQPDRWSVSGQIALRQSENENAVHAYTSRLAKVCADAENNACWRLDQLTIGGSEVDLTDFGQDQGGAPSTTGSSLAGAPRLPQSDEPSAATPPMPGGNDALDASNTPGSDPVDTLSQGDQVADATGDPASAAAPQDTTGQSEVASVTPSEENVAATAEPTPPDAAVTVEAVARQRLISQIQARLQDLGYSPGPVDGLMGPQTRNAIESYQRNHDFPVDGRPSSTLLEHLRGQGQ